MPKPILLCTVGGSHQPILKAIKSAAPRNVCFFCTDRDPETGKPGSIAQVIGSGHVIKASFDADRPTLPNIPTQAELDLDDFETHIVPADDLSGAYAVMHRTAAELAERFPGVGLIADYTGGTKTMSAALVCVALERDDTKLQLVVGARADLIRVRDGTEQAMRASEARLRLRREMALHLAAWRRFAYREAAEGLDRIRITAGADGSTRFRLACALSRALARWDDFDHASALKLVEPYAPRIAPHFPTMLPDLRLLSAGKEEQREPALLFDLWRNAERRAAQGRYDDAIARWYRLMEWTAQWQIRTRLDADTADLPRDLLPPDATVTPDRHGRLKVGLWVAWQVMGCHPLGPAQELANRHGPKLRDLLDLRNSSILAHGFRPIGLDDWQRVRSFSEDHFLPALRDLARDAGLRRDPPQLPTEFPDLMPTAVTNPGRS